VRPMVQIHPGPPFLSRGEQLGGVAQLGERLPCTQEAIGSIPFTSTKDVRVGISSMFVLWVCSLTI
jgi:hypothetical protein